MKCLEIGPGKKKIKPKQGKIWEALQHPVSGKYHKGDIQHDIQIIPWPIKSNTYDLVFMSHVLEHIPWYKTQDVLKEIKRVLKPGGALEVWVPDFYTIIKTYINEYIPDKSREHNPDDDYMLWINKMIFAEGEHPHAAMFDRKYLERCLIRAGYKRVSMLDKPRKRNHKSTNLGVGGIK